MVDALVSGTSVRKNVEVQVLSRAPNKMSQHSWLILFGIEVATYSVAVGALQLRPGLVSSLLLFLSVGIFFGYAPLVQPAAITFIPTGAQASTFAALEMSAEVSVFAGTGLTSFLLLNYSTQATFTALLVASLGGLLIGSLFLQND